MPNHLLYYKKTTHYRVITALSFTCGSPGTVLNGTWGIHVASFRHPNEAPKLGGQFPWAPCIIHREQTNGTNLPAEHLSLKTPTHSAGFRALLALIDD